MKLRESTHWFLPTAWPGYTRLGLGRPLRWFPTCVELCRESLGGPLPLVPLHVLGVWEKVWGDHSRWFLCVLGSMRERFEDPLLLVSLHVLGVCRNV
ncbi:hypothetical protein AVEN_56864-1 [Araneus ventricosus]|uniref:Uncharacterized protein n=1 Tax=Araneus ventricosus TaxID=182803 RepID=A0A4Y2E2K2_ARAVE|nr:hypothetical protein AVEN_56864-1 [Araneus ventricosus]